MERRNLLSLILAVISAGLILFPGASAWSAEGVDSKLAYVSPTPEIQVTDDVLPADDLLVGFGSAAVGEVVEAVVTVTSTGTADLVVGAVSDPEDPFTIVEDNCSGKTLYSSENCTIALQFAPTAIGDFASTFDIPSNAGEMPEVVNLTGTGTEVPVPDIDVSAQSLTFDEATVGESSLTLALAISNLGSADLTVSDVVITGAGAGSFSLDTSGGNDPCGGTSFVLVEGDSCTVEVSFDPAEEGQKDAALEIDSDDPDEATVSVALSGAAAIAAAAAAAAGNGLFINGGGCSLVPLATMNHSYNFVLLLAGFFGVVSIARKFRGRS